MSGFCGQLNPKYCMLLDVGTVPRPAAITNLYTAMEDDPQCGEKSQSTPPCLVIDGSWDVACVMMMSTVIIHRRTAMLPGPH